VLRNIRASGPASADTIGANVRVEADMCQCDACVRWRGGETSRSCAVPAVEHAIEAGSLPTPPAADSAVVRRNSITIAGTGEYS